ncbi:hypothetical protein PR003_g32857 [Phytophthora rubi]|uniref:RxLR effector protein n=1 Tax=Phytophthora rubi TaxID=129364 RepID=A0A6A4B262_9STRA|nr:hypothetical protein PR002_g32400 [Phytophthora rubi]KAE9264282.1 hypothetical protein PR003_g32857 [Phytophthora rubi]
MPGVNRSVLCTAIITGTLMLSSVICRCMGLSTTQPPEGANSPRIQLPRGMNC